MDREDEGNRKKEKDGKRWIGRRRQIETEKERNEVRSTKRARE